MSNSLYCLCRVNAMMSLQIHGINIWNLHTVILRTHLERQINFYARPQGFHKTPLIFVELCENPLLCQTLIFFDKVFTKSLWFLQAFMKTLWLFTKSLWFFKTSMGF